MRTLCAIIQQEKICGLDTLKEKLMVSNVSFYPTANGAISVKLTADWLVSFPL